MQITVRLDNTEATIASSDAMVRGISNAAQRAARCPHCVTLGPGRSRSRCPFWPREPTSLSASVTSEKGHERKCPPTLSHVRSTLKANRGRRRAKLPLRAEGGYAL